VSPALVSPALVSPALVSPALVSPALVSPEGQARASAAADARVRLAHQIPDAEKAARADYVLENTGDIESLHAQVRELWMRLKAESNKFLEDESLK